MDRSADGLSAAQIARDLRALGVAPGGTLMVHSSLSALGWVDGGAPTVIRALLAVLGPEGTLVLPAFRDGVFLEGLRDAAPEEALARARAEPVFDPASAPTNLGAIPEAFRCWPGVLRSAHPYMSVCALGPLAQWIVAPHALAWGTGPSSPFARLVEIDAQLLLLGVGPGKLSLFHHAETLVASGRRKTRQVPTPTGIVLSPDAGNDRGEMFPEIGARLLATGAARSGTVGQAKCHVIRAAQAVNFAINSLESALTVR